jgi:hypothetical protein
VHLHDGRSFSLLSSGYSFGLDGTGQELELALLMMDYLDGYIAVCYDDGRMAGLIAARLAIGCCERRQRLQIGDHSSWIDYS